MDETNNLVIGIDLGTTNTCAAFFRNDTLKVLENQEGHYTTPSFVFYQNAKEVTVGNSAVNLAGSKPEHGVYEVKRLIGRQFQDEELQQIVKNLPYEVREIEDYPFAYFKEFDISVSPVDICFHILEKIKKDSSVKTGSEISKAVITVPAHFNVTQRKATLRAAEKAGFTVLKLLSEPTAAALNYFYEKINEKDLKKEYCLVFDLGGGTFDVAIVQCEGNEINIVGVDGDSYLGGHDFDNLILNYARDQFRENYKSDVEFTKPALRRLKNESRKAKETLYTVKTAPIILESFLGVDAVEIPITRSKFDELGQDLFQKCIAIVDRCLKKSGLEKNNIDQVILAGGSSRIKKLEEMLQNYFDGKKLNQTLHPEQCVALGAALQAAMLSKNPKQKIKQFRIVEVTSSSLGVADLVQRMDFIIKKDTPIPTSGSITHANVRDKQDAVYFHVYEGERLDVRKNICLGELKVTNLTPAPPQKCKITVTMSIDNNGILTVTAKEKHKENVKDLEIALLPHFQKRIVANKSSGDEYTEDHFFNEFANIKQFLILYCEAIVLNLHQLDLARFHKLIRDKCLKTEQEIVQLDVKDKDSLINMGREIVKSCDPLVSKHKFKNMPSGNSSLTKELKKVSDSSSSAGNTSSISYGHVRVDEKFFK